MWGHPSQVPKSVSFQHFQPKQPCKPWHGNSLVCWSELPRGSPAGMLGPHSSLKPPRIGF